VGLWLGIAAAVTSQAAPLGEFLAGLARPAPDRVSFTEVRFSPLLDAALVVSGELEYLGPGELSRHVREPYEERTVIEGDRVTVSREGEAERSFSLKRAPELRGLLASFAAMLAGDARTLERFFTPKLTGPAGDDARWTLELEPRREKLHARLGTLRVYGTKKSPHCISMGGAGGQGSVILLGPAASAAQGEPRTQDGLERLCADFR